MILLFIGVIRCYCCDGHLVSLCGDGLPVVGLVGGGGTFLFVPFRALSGPFSSAYYRGEFGVSYNIMVWYSFCFHGYGKRGRTRETVLWYIPPLI